MMLYPPPPPPDAHYYIGYWIFTHSYLLDSSGDYHAQFPGAIPVATLVPDDVEVQQPKPMPTAPVQAVASSYIAPPQQQQNPTEQVGFVSDPTMTRNPMMMRICPNCSQESRTRIRTFPTWQTWVASLVLFLAFWPVCWIPLVVDACKQTDHFCVLCGAHVGQVSAFQDCCVSTRT
jgi:hypothetical protein